jgi:MFS family permease
LFVLWPESLQWQLGEYRVPHAAVFLFFGGIVSSFWIGPTFAAIQTLTPDHLRSQASALILLLVNLIGLGLGPVVVGVLSDLLAPEFGVESIRYAMLISLVTIVIGSILYWMGGDKYRGAITQEVST